MPFVNPSADSLVIMNIVDNLKCLEQSIDLLISLESPPRDILQMKLSEMNQQLDKIPSANVSLKEQWQDKFSHLMAKCAVPCDEHSSGFIEAEKSNLTQDITMMIEDEMEDEEAEIRRLMYLEPIDVALIDERMANWMDELDRHLSTLTSASKWLEKISQLVSEYVERRIVPEGEVHKDNLQEECTEVSNTNTGLVSPRAASPVQLNSTSKSQSQVKLESFSEDNDKDGTSALPDITNELKSNESKQSMDVEEQSTVEDSRSASLTTTIDEASVASTEADDGASIDAKIKEAFNKLAPTDEVPFGSEEYQVAISDLLALVVKSRKIVTVLGTDNKTLLREVLDWARSKLSIAVRREYNRRFKRPNMSSMIRFLCRHLVEVTQPPLGIPRHNVCRYCQLPGHYVAGCPKVKLITCFRCFEHGHRKNLCGNEEATAEDLLASL